ncbi:MULTISPECIES: hypothetical protein [unclassified Haladaptatus]|uniref:hypothetical protein n=1 Tax=unclassified Haladaptatus TaxID=2622732 RepID=UPI0023E7AC04|nr:MULTISPECIES: hypothetical protein [unclassified Haladaptatus]
MNQQESRKEGVLLIFLIVLGAVDITVNLIASQRIAGSFITQLLVVGLLALAIEVLYRHGRGAWTILAASLLGIGAVSDALVTFIGVPGLVEFVPKLLWSLGLLITLHSRRGGTAPVKIADAS